MLRFSTEQRTFVAEGLRDIANLAVAGLVFGQFLADRPFSMAVAALGIMIWMALMSCAVVLRAKRE